MSGVEQALAGLAASGDDVPPGLDGRVFAGWLTAPSLLGDVHVAVTGDGVQFLRAAADGPADRFAEAYRERFGRPLRALTRPPRGLLPALRTPAPGRTGDHLAGDPTAGAGSGPASGRRPEPDLGTLSEFERAVLEATRRIPAGQTRPYAWVAREAGRPTAVRAAASVLARNPVPLLVPCHRVVRGTGELGEYMYGPDRKRALLRAEDLDVDALDAATARGELFVASATTGIVCFPSCHHARRITGGHRRPFRRVAAALDEGFRPCRDCRPAVPVRGVRPGARA